MKEHGLIFGAVSMLGILKRDKTMTRRVVAYHNSTINGPTCSRVIWDELDFDHAFADQGPSPAGNAGPYLRVAFPKTDGFQSRPRHDCQYRVYPRVQVGDVIRCKEAWMPVVRYTQIRGDPEVDIEYKSDNVIIRTLLPDGTICPIARFSKKIGEQMWSSPVFMPRWVSRAFLPVTEVVAQRVQDISEADAIAEGAFNAQGDDRRRALMFALRKGSINSVDYFREIWDTINALRGHPWSRSDWTWGYRWKEVTR